MAECAQDRVVGVERGSGVDLVRARRPIRSPGLRFSTAGATSYERTRPGKHVGASGLVFFPSNSEWHGHASAKEGEIVHDTPHPGPEAPLSLKEDRICASAINGCKEMRAGGVTLSLTFRSTVQV